MYPDSIVCYRDVILDTIIYDNKLEMSVARGDWLEQMFVAILVAMVISTPASCVAMSYSMTNVSAGMGCPMEIVLSCSLRMLPP